MNTIQSKKIKKSKRLIAGTLILTYASHMLFIPIVLAAPVGLSSSTPGVSFSGVGTSNTTITSSAHRSIVNAQGFDTVRGETVNVIQSNNASMMIRIGGAPTSYDGILNAMGQLILLNPNGIIFGPNAQINVGALIASSLHLTDANFLAGQYLFQGTGIEGVVRNMGAINGTSGVYLLAPNVENHGVITSPGGNIVLAAGATAYLSNRPDGNGLLAELRAPSGQALNVGELRADGGNISMAGLVVNQNGLVQANGVREKNGRIELFASETLTLKAGSQTLAKGGSDGVSDGGTILAVADTLKGAASFEKGAIIDVSGGKNGGHAGFAELSGSRVRLGGRFIGLANAGYRSGRLLIDPTMDLDLTGFTATGFSDISFATPRDGAGNLLAGYDLRVTGSFDLNSVEPPANGGIIRFEAGRDLMFNDLILNNSLILFKDVDGTMVPVPAPVRPWDIVGIAERSILFTGFTGTTLQTAHGGSINLQAKAGDVNLIDPLSGVLATVTTIGGGGISIKTGRDLIASPGFDTQGIFSGQGISIDGSGRLSLDVGRDFIGGPVNGVPRGPGFVLWNSDPALRPHHTVTVGGKIGQTNLTLGANGLPLTVAEQRAINPNAPLEVESSARYADFAVSGGDLTISAGGNIYLRRVQDAGLVGGLDALGNPRDPAFAAGFENTTVTLVSRDGHIIFNTSRTAAGTPEPITDLADLRSWLPASFEARAENGTIQIRSDLTFLPSPTGSVKFFAKQDIQGVAKTNRQNNPNYEWVYVGVPGVPGGHWQPVDRTTIAAHPELWESWANRNNLPANIQSTRPGEDTFPDSTKIDVDASLPRVRLLEVNPNSLIGNTVYGQMAPWAKASVRDLNVPLAPDNTTALAQVSFTTALGNISKLVLDLVSRPFRKEVTIEAGNKIDMVAATMYLPDLGTTTHTITEHIPLFVDPVTNQARAITQSDVVLIRAIDPVTNQVVVRPWNGIEAVSPADIVNVVFRDVPVTVTTPTVSATIKAKDFVLNRSESGDGGLTFYGPGTARIIATNNLDLGSGRGILSFARPDRSPDRQGLIDIAVGNNLDMVTSAIITSGGAGISIHGYDESKPPYLVGYDNSKLYPLEFPDSARTGLNLPAVGGKVNVGENSARSLGTSNRQTGIQVAVGGSVGQLVREAVVNPDGTVTANVVKDPAGILILARGDIDVNKSKIATFSGSDIRLTTTHGSINSGSGSKDERVNFDLPTGRFDATGKEITVPVEVPGSGIFTFHVDDPKPIVFPEFNDPQVNALLAEAGRQRIFGRDVSQLETAANQLRAERLAAFERDVLNPFIDRLRLGDVVLTAETGARAIARGTVPADGSGRIFVSEAGILGKNVVLDGVTVFRGGRVTGRAILPPNFVPSNPSFTGLPPGGVAAGGLLPLSGGGSAAAASSTAAASSSTVKNSEQVQEDVSDSSSKQGHSSQVASKKDSAKEEKSQLARSVRVKRGVVIQVDVKPQQGS